MKLSEAVKTIKDYCSKKECADCIFGELYKIDRYNGKIWYCKLRGTPYEWEEPPETNEVSEEFYGSFADQVD